MRLPVQSIRWKLILGSLLAVGLPLLVFALALGSMLWRFYVGQLQQELLAKAQVIATAVAPALSPRTPDDPASLRQMVDLWRQYSNMRVTVIDQDGRIQAATTETDVGQPVDEETRPGMRDALKGQTNWMVWKSPNFAFQDTMYVNLPALDGGTPVGAVRVSYSLAQIQQNIGRIRAALLASFGVYAVIIVALTIGLAGSIVRPVEELNRSAQLLAAGDLEHQVKETGSREVVQLATTLNQMTARLRQLEGLRRQYVSNVSHELRTPLASIRGMAETLLLHGRSDPTLVDRYLPRIIGQTERLARLASQLLDLAQIESGNLVGAKTPVSLEAVVDEAVHTAGENARRKGVRIETDLAVGLPEVPGDRDRLVQVFLNLVDNAARHTPTEGTVRVSAWAEGDCVVAEVTDTGCGIPEEHLPHLFERFYRVDQARSREGGGTGLGLSIVEQIVRVHGGTIDVRSTVGRGTTFSIRLPLGGPDAVRTRETQSVVAV